MRQKAKRLLNTVVMKLRLLVVKNFVTCRKVLRQPLQIQTRLFCLNGAKITQQLLLKLVDWLRLLNLQAQAILCKQTSQMELVLVASKQ